MENLSRSFKLKEFTRSQIADKEGISNELHLPEDAWICENLQSLCKYILEPLRAYLGTPLFINSGYRCKRLNELVGGVENSQHLTGCAADVTFQHYISSKELLWKYFTKNRSHIPFDQVIFYRNFVHISYSNNPRHQILWGSPKP